MTLSLTNLSPMRNPIAVCSLAAALLLAGCRESEANTESPRGNVRIAVVTHGQAADPFWSVVANGVRAAAADLGVKVDYQAPTRFDMVEMSNLIDAAVAGRPSALVISIPDAAALSPSIRKAVEAGIPVISINSGAQASRQLGLLAHIGQSEYDAGYAAGARLGAAGARRVLCVNHEVGNAGLDERCRGLGDALVLSGATMRVLGIDLGNPDDAHQRITSALRSDATIDALLTLGPGGAQPALAAAAALALTGLLAVVDAGARLQGITNSGINYLALPSHLEPFFRGIVASVDIAYFALLAGVALALAARRLDALRGSAD